MSVEQSKHLSLTSDGLPVITQKEVHDVAVSKGWWEDYPDPLKRLPESLMLTVSELAECLEEYRNGRGPNEVYYEQQPNGTLKPCGIAYELADAIIRIRDTAESLDIELESYVSLKHQFNKTRPYKHGGKKG